MDLEPKLIWEIKGLKFVENKVYPNGSVYKGQILDDERYGYGIQ